jgi:hypothetical protein
LDSIDQAAIDEAAVAIYPNVTPATRNGAVYTPVSAILHHAGVNIIVKRPKGSQGQGDDAVPAAARRLCDH